MVQSFQFHQILSEHPTVYLDQRYENGPLDQSAVISSLTTKASCLTVIVHLFCVGFGFVQAGPWSIGFYLFYIFF